MIPPHCSQLTSAVVIATRNRPQPLRQCLESLNRQSVLPDQVLIVDSSDGGDTKTAVETLRSQMAFPVTYIPTAIRSAARQRNFGAEQVSTDLIFFLDDDVVLERDFVAEIVKVFQNDSEGRIGGVTGTIVNQVYSPIKGFNRLLLGLCTGHWRGSFAGRLVGPAVNFLPEDGREALQQIDWAPSCCVCYRTSVFMQYGFENTFEGYSFAEDVHLSAQIAKSHKLLNTTRARLYHHDLGGSTHQNWAELGQSMVIHRHLIMTKVLGKRRFTDQVRLFLFEMVYGTLSLLASRRPPKIVWPLLVGKARGFWKLWTEKAA